MDNQAAVREFLRSRRARVTPAEAGLIGGDRRRVGNLTATEAAASDTVDQTLTS